MPAFAGMTLRGFVLSETAVIPAQAGIQEHRET